MRIEHSNVTQSDLLCEVFQNMSCRYQVLSSADKYLDPTAVRSQAVDGEHHDSKLDSSEGDQNSVC